MFLSVIFSNYFLLLSLMFMLCFLVGLKMVGLKMIKFCFVLCLNVLTCSTFREYTMMVLNFAVIIWLKCDFSFQSTIIFALGHQFFVSFMKMCQFWFCSNSMFWESHIRWDTAWKSVYGRGTSLVLQAGFFRIELSST
jgi:hypothetical protein